MIGDNWAGARPSLKPPYRTTTEQLQNNYRTTYRTTTEQLIKTVVSRKAINGIKIIQFLFLTTNVRGRQFL
jgi:hypothetical protein